jgi:hypothetical protein
MEILKFENSPRPARKKSSSSKIVLGFASIAAVAMLGSTLAASITLNDNTNVEFGQGVAQTTACDSDGITLTPGTSFVNGTPGYFQMETITATGVNVNADKCLNKDFKISAYDSVTASALETYTFTWTSGSEAPSNGTVVLSGSDVNGEAVFSLSSPLNLTTFDVAKLTLETSD